jgi:hypothetical protein
VVADEEAGRHSADSTPLVQHPSTGSA